MDRWSGRYAGRWIDLWIIYTSEASDIDRNVFQSIRVISHPSVLLRYAVSAWWAARSGVTPRLLSSFYISSLCHLSILMDSEEE